MTGGGFQGAPAWSATDVAVVLAAGAAATGMSMTSVPDGASAAEAVAGGTSGEGLSRAAGIDPDKVVNSSLVETFCNVATPELEPSMKVGDTVREGQVVGIIEAMKLMNEIECGFNGAVEAVLVDNGDVMEYGQPLFRIR